MKPLEQQAAEAAAMIEARNAAGNTPESVRKAFLGQRHDEVPGLSLESWSIGIMWLLEELAHPLLGGQGDVKITARDAARALLAFHDSDAAYNALSHGTEDYDQEAFRLVRSLPPASVIAAGKLIPQIIAEGLATIPGAGASDPSGTGS